MAEKRKCGQNFTADEKEKLMKLSVSHKDTILNKKTDGATNEAKQKAWMNVTDKFNSSGTIFRTKESLMKMWEKLKTESKLYFQIKKQKISGTGGGPSELKVDPILEQVCVILGRACTGILGVQDCDYSYECENPPTNIAAENDVVIEYQDIFIQQPPTTEDGNEGKSLTQDVPSKDDVPLEKCSTPSIPLWSRRRPQITQTNERTEAVSSLCTSYTTVNKKKEDIEDLKKILLQEEIEFKRKLFELQLEAAKKEVEIKAEVLKQIKGGGLNMQALFGVPEKK